MRTAQPRPTHGHSHTFKFRPQLRGYTSSWLCKVTLGDSRTAHVPCARNCLPTSSPGREEAL